jgi:hypothetical protein
MKPIKPFSLSTGLKPMKANLHSMWYTWWQKNKNKVLRFQNRMWPLLDHNNGNNPEGSKQNSVTMAMDPEAKGPTEETPTAGQCKLKVPKLPEMVNSVSTAKS